MTRVTFIKANSFDKKDKTGKWYVITLLVGEETVKCFTTGENFKKIMDKKPVYKKEYNADFEIKAMYEKLNVELVDLNDIK